MRAKLTLGFCLSVSILHGATYSITSNADSGAGTLRDALQSIFQNSNASDTVDFSGISGQTITLTASSPLCVVSSTQIAAKTIDFTNSGSKVILDGNGNQGLFIGPIASGNTVTSSVSGIAFQNCKSVGGAGGSPPSDTRVIACGGGGGMGAGGAIFVADGATVTVSNCDFTTCSATGGSGGAGIGAIHGDGAGSGGGGGGYGATAIGGTSTSSLSGDQGGGGGGGFYTTGGFGVGGNGATGGGGGGGGAFFNINGGTTVYGNGGSGGGSSGGGGGGSAGTLAANGSNGFGQNGGNGGSSIDGTAGGAGGAFGVPGGAGVSGAGAGGGGFKAPGGSASPSGCGGGGGGTGSPLNLNGGDGGLFGGGGGVGVNATGNLSGVPGDGGYLGGGGGLANSGGNDARSSGAGGFGGGGGGGYYLADILANNRGVGGDGGLGGGGGGGNMGGDGGEDAGAGGSCRNSSPPAAAGGGGGAGLGGAIFVSTNGSLILGSGNTFSPNNTVTGGAGGVGVSNSNGASGSGQGSDLYVVSGALELQGTNTLTGTMAVSPGTPLTLTSPSTGELDLTKPLRATAQINISGGVTLGAGGSLGTGSAIAIGSGATLRGMGTFVGIQNLALSVGSSIAVDSSVVMTFPTTSGTGALTLSGAGMLKLTGSAAHTGGTVIQAGPTLALSGSGSLPSTGAISVDGTFDISQITSSLSSQIGPLSGSGHVNLGGNTLAVNSTSDSTFSGTIGDGGAGGSLTKSGGSTLILGGMNTYAGTTTVSDGTLKAQIADAFSPNSDMALSGGDLDLNSLSQTISSLSGNGGVFLGATGSFAIAGSKTTTFSGSISDGGDVSLQGGTLTLTGNSSYSGATTVSASTLIVNGSLTSSPVTVGSGGRLKGTGSIAQGVTIQNGGSIQGGNSIGTITLGSLTLSSGTPGSNLVLEINDSGSSTLYDVANSVSLSGNLDVVVDRGVYQAGTTYTFITSGSSSITGAFDTFTTTAPGTKGFSGRLDIEPDAVKLILIQAVYPIILTTGLQGNAKNLADYLNSLAYSPAIQPVLLAIGALPPSEAQAALDSISPARNAIASWTAQNTLFGINKFAGNRIAQQRFMKNLETRKATVASRIEIEEGLIASRKFMASGKEAPYGKTQTAAREDNKYAIWAEGLGQFAHQNAVDENPAFNAATGSGLIGADYYGLKHCQLGGAVGYAYSNIQESGTGHGTINTYLAGIYGTREIQNAYVEMGLWGAFNQFSNRRNVIYPGFSAVAKSDHNGWQLIPHLGAGYDFGFEWGALEPFASFDPAVLFQDGYSEHGAGTLDMSVKSSTSWLLQTQAGVNAYQIKRCSPGTLIFRETLSYVNLAPFGTGKLSGTALVGYPPGFTVTSFTEVQNMISPGFEIFFKSRHNGFFLSLAYDGEFTIGKGRYMSNEGIARIGGFF